MVKIGLIRGFRVKWLPFYSHHPNFPQVFQAFTGSVIVCADFFGKPPCADRDIAITVNAAQDMHKQPQGKIRVAAAGADFFDGCQNIVPFNLNTVFG